MKVVTVVGARPQFIKAAPVSRVLRESGHREVLVHTGQHYDHAMSRLFFEELAIPEPDHDLGVGSAGHAAQTARMLAAIEPILVGERPDWVLVYGDTNSTLAGALATVKLDPLLAHVEAGLRSFNPDMPEEHNRVLTDHAADARFCPTPMAVHNLRDEGIHDGVELVGDTMCDLLLNTRARAHSLSAIMERLTLEPRGYYLATIHRAYNADEPEHLDSILSAFGRLEERVVLPIHPRTRERIKERAGGAPPVPENVEIIDPVGYLDMIVLQENARVVLTDSGGMQKEAFLLGVPCVTLRPETEWVETVEAGWNVVVGRDPDRIVETATRGDWPDPPPPPLYGDGRASWRIVEAMERWGR